MTPQPSTPTPSLPPRAWFVFGLLVFGFVATLAFWVIWFFVDRDILASAHTSEYYTFENAFPLADAWMALAGLLGAIAIYRRRASAGFWCVAGGSVSVYLAGLDILFDLQNGIYRAPTGNVGAVIVEVCINVLTLFMGAYLVIWAWRNRRALAKLDGF